MSLSTEKAKELLPAQGQVPDVPLPELDQYDWTTKFKKEFNSCVLVGDDVRVIARILEEWKVNKNEEKKNAKDEIDSTYWFQGPSSSQTPSSWKSLEEQYKDKITFVDVQDQKQRKACDDLLKTIMEKQEEKMKIAHAAKKMDGHSAPLTLIFAGFKHSHILDCFPDCTEAIARYRHYRMRILFVTEAYTDAPPYVRKNASRIVLSKLQEESDYHRFFCEFGRVVVGTQEKAKVLIRKYTTPGNMIIFQTEDYVKLCVYKIALY